MSREDELHGPTLLGIARAAVAERLGAPHQGQPTAEWLERSGRAFVTLRKGGRLHGCIGSVEAERSLRESVARNAALAAFEDPRSSPLHAEDLPDVRFEVSVLSEPERVDVRSEEDAIAELRPGVDGVIVSRRDRRAVFLPQVWRTLPEPRDFLGRLKRKAGLPETYWDDEMKVERFSVRAFHEPGYQEA